MPDTIANTPGRKEIVDIYARALGRLKDVVSGEDYTLASKRYAARQIIEIQDHIKALRKAQAKWAEIYIPKAYKNGSLQDEELLNRLLGNDYKGTMTALHREAAQVAAIGAVQDFEAVSQALENTFVGYVRRAQVTGAKRAVAQDIAGGIVEGSTRATVSNRLVDTLKANTVAGTITVGKVTMNVNAYADLLARTVSRAARTEGTLNRLTENGLDLVIFNNTGAVDFCKEYEDQIFSISGQSKRYPKLVARPPFHPNCTHTLSAFIEEFATDEEVARGLRFNQDDLNKTATEMNRKYPVEKNDTRARTKKTQKRAA